MELNLAQKQSLYRDGFVKLPGAVSLDWSTPPGWQSTLRLVKTASTPRS
jgi:hypothetical protein